eukprot:4021658-Amphidinium_carterae.1
MARVKCMLPSARSSRSTLLPATARHRQALQQVKKGKHMFSFVQNYFSLRLHLVRTSHILPALDEKRLLMIELLTV